MNLTIDPEFKNLIPPLTSEEYAGLEESILAEGCRDSLVAWHGILIDGHNRYEICEKYGIPYSIMETDFESRDAVKLWMMKNQLARRNLNDFQRVEITHKCEDAVKAKAKERQATSTGGTAPQLMENFPQADKGASRDELGKMAGVSGKTYEHAVIVMEEAPEPIVEATRRNDISINAAYQVTKMEPEQQEEISERIKNGETPKVVISDVQKRPHVAYNSGNNEWYTPKEFIEAATAVMGCIDLDPASSEIANKTVGAKRIYTIEDNGLEKPWFGNVWLNPPYASDLIGKFADKLVDELKHIKQAIVLVNNATETEWFYTMVTQATAVCFPRSRVKFYTPSGTTGAPLQGQAILYFGPDVNRFINVFDEKGWCARL